ncbi:MAG: hypothetical protein V4490_03215, partial [Pseudomonadota bacterium]
QLLQDISVRVNCRVKGITDDTINGTVFDLNLLRQFVEPLQAQNPDPRLLSILASIHSGYMRAGLLAQYRDAKVEAPLVYVDTTALITKSTAPKTVEQHIYNTIKSLQWNFNVCLKSPLKEGTRNHMFSSNNTLRPHILLVLNFLDRSSEELIRLESYNVSPEAKASIETIHSFNRECHRLLENVSNALDAQIQTSEQVSAAISAL